MTLTEQIAAAEQVVVEDQTKLTNDETALTALKTKLDDIQPHLTVLDQIEAELEKVGTGAEADVAAALTVIENSIKPLIGQMRSLFLGQ